MVASNWAEHFKGALRMTNTATTQKKEKKIEPLTPTGPTNGNRD